MSIIKFCELLPLVSLSWTMLIHFLFLLFATKSLSRISTLIDLIYDHMVNGEERLKIFFAEHFVFKGSLLFDYSELKGDFRAFLIYFYTRLSHQVIVLSWTDRSKIYVWTIQSCVLVGAITQINNVSKKQAKIVSRQISQS